MILLAQLPHSTRMAAPRGGCITRKTDDGRLQHWGVSYAHGQRETSDMASTSDVVNKVCNLFSPVNQLGWI